jgi:tetratricopeptide (TPR) repeat protein
MTILKDIYGNAVSTSSQKALDAFNDAQRQIRTYHGDPIATLDRVLEHDPGFSLAWTTRAVVLAQLTDRMFADDIAGNLRAASVARMNDRERSHFAGAVAWAEGRFHDGATIFGRIAQDNPRDVLALQNGHVGCFFTGRQFDLRDWPVQAMRAHRFGEEGWHAILGMAAFGLEECGDYARAETYGEEAIEAEPSDAWAAHAVAHVHEMRGDTEAGMGWLEGTSEGWSTECGFAYHNWWHLALLHLDRQDYKAVLKLFDTRIWPEESNLVLQMIDATAMLWRLHLEGADTGDRFPRLARAWERTINDGVYAFNDLHAMMAFIGAGRMSDAERMLETMRRSAHGHSAPGWGDNAEMTRAVGLPAAEAFLAFASGRHTEAVEKLANVRGIAQRFGGSHAQRDIISLTLLQAAIRGGMKPAAEAFSAERLTLKPQSPWAARLSRQARNIGAGQPAAAK